MIRAKLYILDIYIFLSKYFGKYITCLCSITEIEFLNKEVIYSSMDLVDFFDCWTRV